MKKKLTIAFAVLLCLSFLAACGGGGGGGGSASAEDAFVGTWEMTTIEMDGEVLMDMADYAELGISSTLTFGADMAVTYDMMGEAITGTWEADGSTFTMNFEEAGEAFAMTGTIDGDTLAIEEEGGQMNFVRVAE